MNTTKFSDAKLFFALLEADGELFEQGVPPKRRVREVVLLARKKLGLGTIVSLNPLTPENKTDTRLRHLFQRFYGEDAFRNGFGHGVVEFRGVAYLVKVPIIFGQVRIEPFEHSALTPLQVETITRDKLLFSQTIFQIGDAFDATMGLANKLTHQVPPPLKERSLANRLFSEGRKNFFSACTLASHSLDIRECVLSSFVAMELCVKGFLAECGCGESQIKELGHNPKRFLKALQQQKNCGKLPRIEYVFQNAPDFVATRYGDNIVAEMEAVKFLIGVQYVIAELMRISGNKSFLHSLDQDVKRQWPPAIV